MDCLEPARTAFFIDRIDRLYAAVHLVQQLVSGSIIDGLPRSCVYTQTIEDPAPGPTPLGTSQYRARERDRRLLSYGNQRDAPNRELTSQQTAKPKLHCTPTVLVL